MFCRQCGAELSSNQQVCVKCGVPVGKGSSFCQQCGNPTSDFQEVCLHCGVRLANTSNEFLGGELGGHGKVTIAIVCFFVGGFGVHNFMMKENKKGLLRLLTSFIGLGGLLALVDFVKILLNKYDVEPDKYI